MPPQAGFSPETSPTLKALVDGLAKAAPTSDTPKPELVTAALGSAAAAHGWLPDERRRANHDRYSRHLIYADPQGRFSLLAIVWGPGQVSPIHTHRVWSAVAVCQGALTETVYDRIKSKKAPVATKNQTHIAGWSRFYPAETVIHRLANRNPDNTITLHVYGISAALVSTGINVTFGETPNPPAY